MKRAALIAGGVIAGLFALLVVVIGVGFGLLQTGAGKAWLARELSRLLSTPPAEVAITGITGQVPFDMHVETVRFSDAAGTWLAVDNGHIAIAPADLMRGRLTFRDLSAAAIRFLRPSQAGSSGGIDLNPPLPVRIDHLAVERFELGPELLGEEMLLTLGGSGAIGDGMAAADLALRRIDATPGEIALHFDYGGTPAHLRLAADIAEPSGRVLAELLDRQQPLPLAVKLEGEGPLSNWRGSLSAKAGDAASLRAQAQITASAAQGGAHRVALDGVSSIAALFPGKYGALVGAQQDFSAHLAFGDDAVMIDDAAIEIGAGTMTAHGRIDRKTDALALGARIGMPDLARLAPLAGGALSGSGQLDLAVTGDRTKPRIDGRFALADLAAAGHSVRRAAGEIVVTPEGPVGDSTTRFALNGSGRIDGVAGVPAGIGEAVDWEIVAAAQRAGTRFDLSELALKDAAGATLEASAAGDANGASGELMLRVPDINTVAGGDRHGALALAAAIKAAADGSATAVLSGTLDNVSGAGHTLDAALGPKIGLSGALRRDTDGRMRLDDLAVTAAAATLAAHGERSADGKLALDYRLAVPRLSAVDPGVAGAATLSGRLTGPLDALAADATFEATGLATSRMHIDEVKGHLALAPLDRPSGPLDIAFRSGKLGGTAAAAIALEPGVALRLSNLRVAAAGANLSGTVSLGLADHALSGKISGDVPDLRPWSDLAGAPLSGKLRLDAALAGTAGQSVDLTVDGSGLGYAGASLRTLLLEAHLRDLLREPRGRAMLRLAGGKAGSAELDRAELQATTERPGRFAVTAAISARHRQPIQLTLAAEAEAARGDVTLRVRRLDGTLAGARLALQKPLTIAERGGDISVADLALGLGAGRLAGDGALKRQTISLHLLAQALPLAPLAQLGSDAQMSGVLGFELTVDGTRAQPQGKFVLDGEQLRFAAASRPDLPPLGVVADADWHGGRVAMKGRIAGPQGAAVGFSGAVPLVMESKGYALHMPPDGAVALHVEGGGDIANIADLLPLGEDRLAGKFAIDISVGGTVAAPAASGRLEVSNGRYESLAAGTVLDGMHFALVGDRERLVLHDFAATDGGSGRLDVSGMVDLAATPGPAVDIAARLVSFRAVRLDEAMMQTSGDVRINGTVEEPLIAAVLRIDGAELRVPEKLQKAVQPIPVTVIDSATGQVLSTPEQQAGRKAFLAVRLNVKVEAPGQVFLRGRGFDSEWRGQISIAGTTAAPQLTGKLEVVHGSYDLIGKTFTINKGTIAFLGGNRIDPVIDAVAQARSSDIVVTVHITGTAFDPKIQFSSEPALPQDEILARLLFGSSLSQLSPAQGLQIAAAAAQLATGGGPDVLDRIRTGLGLDRFTIGSSSTTSALMPGLGVPGIGTNGPPGSGVATGPGTTPLPVGLPGTTSSSSAFGGTAVSAGKYVAEGVYVGVSQGLSAASSTVTAQIDVTRHITIETEAGQQVGTGIGVNWKLDY